MSALWDVQENGRKSVFCEHPVKRSYYFPSTSHKLDPDTKQSKLCSSHENMVAVDEEFLNMFHVYPYQQDSGSPNFDESWPHSEKRTFDMEQVAQFDQGFDGISHSSSLASEWTRKMHNGETHCDSVLAKYIERFHHAVPQSREQRRNQLERQEFWWLCEKHNTLSMSISEGEMNNHPKQTIDAGSNYQVSEMTLCTDEHYFDDKTSHLLRKTNELLEIASSLSSREPAVSTDGIGSDSSIGSVACEEPFRPQFTKITDAHLMNSGPEDDILEQWRHMRRLEVAQKNISVIQKDASTTHILSEQSKSHGQPQQEQQVACDTTKSNFTCHHGSVLQICTHDTPFGCKFHLPCKTLSSADCRSADADNSLSSDEMIDSVQPTDTYNFQQSLHNNQRTQHVSISLPEVNHLTATESTMTESHRRGHMNHSTFSAAFVNSPVEQTIEQVVKERLFDVSDSFTVVSSVDSKHLDSYTCQQDKEMLDTIKDTEATLMSDGEEFADDQILKDLRHRRATYLHVLLKLDCMISGCAVNQVN